MGKAYDFKKDFIDGYNTGQNPPSLILGGSDVAFQRGFTMAQWDKAEGKNDPEAAFKRYYSVGEKLFPEPAR